MSEQASPGWYPDGQGNERYWDGAAWTEHLRAPAGTGTATPKGKKDGPFAKVGASLKKAAAERQVAKEELGRKQAEDAQAAGTLVTRGVFGTSTIEIYESAFVRVAAGSSDASVPATITSSTPYEKLRSIKCSLPGRDDSSASTDASGLLKGAAGLMKGTGLAKGGAGLLKGGMPGLVVAGLTQVAAAQSGKSSLTIVTDAQIHTLTNQSNTGIIKKSHKEHNEVGLALEAAGNSVLSANGVAAPTHGSKPQRGTQSQPALVNHAEGRTLADRLRELADLHHDGILSDEEFAAAKAQVLGQL